jgi:hypothetical protein
MLNQHLTLLKKVLKVLYPNRSFKCRINKKGVYEILLLGVVKLEFDNIINQTFFTFVNGGNLYPLNFLDNVIAFHPDLKKDNVTIKYRMNVGGKCYFMLQ